MYHKYFIPLSLVLLSMMLFGCNGRSQVSGKITFENGEPLICGNVKARTDDGIEVKGIIKQDGSFTLYEFKAGDGIPSGKQYKVWIANAIKLIPSTQTFRVGSIIETGPPTEMCLVHKDFTNADTASLVLNVPKGAHEISYDIIVKKP